MRIAIAGLGRMGFNMARRLLRAGHEVHVFDRTFEKARSLAPEGAVPAATHAELVAGLKGPRVVWLMLPAGEITQSAMDSFSSLLSRGDVIVDGGNSNFKDSVARAKALAALGIDFVDAGVSGGVWGLEKGYCIMCGGEKRSYDLLLPALKSLCAEGGLIHCGSHGSGHFTKMVHNGIEYAMMESYAEGFEIMKRSRYGDELDLGAIAAMWNNGSVVRSWLLELLRDALSKEPDLASLKPYVDDSGEGRWTVEEAVATGVPAPAISAALFRRFSSRENDAFSGKILAALRREFGGHAVKEK